MTAKDAFNLADGEKAIRLSHDEIMIIYRSLQRSEEEADHRRKEYIEGTPIGSYNNAISSGLSDEASAIHNLKNAIINNTKEL